VGASPDRRESVVLIALEAGVDAAGAAGTLAEAGYETRVCETGEEILRLARLLRPRLVVLGVCLPGVSGYECCYELRAEFGRTPPIVLVSGKRTQPLDCTVGLLLGADDVLVAPFSPGQLLARVTRLVGAPAAHADSGLTDREAEILALLADGLQQKEVARSLGISPKTVSTHVERIHRKLGAHNRMEAVSRAQRAGLL
jgi:DNA-binding NarL/FixJ family response regulator